LEEENDMIEGSELKSISRFVSLALRQEPQLIGLHLDEADWASVDDLLARAASAGKAISRERLQAENGRSRCDL